jgi:hypothetical protein
MSGRIEKFKQVASNYALFEDAEKFVRENNIRDQCPYALSKPNRLYLVYLCFDAQGKLIVRQLKAEFQAQSDLGQTEVDLFNSAASGNAANQNFEDMKWWRSTYLTFVIHNPGWSFYWRDDDRRHNPIRFLRRKDAIEHPTDLYQDNHCFFDALKPFELDDGNGELHSAFRCINYVVDENGFPLQKKQVHRYCFQIYLEAPFLLNGREEKITMLIDPDGQNQGPPARRRRVK